MSNRPTWDEYFMKLTTVVAERSTCLRHNVGAVIVRDKRILSTGYNGSPKGEDNCCDLGYCLKNKLGIASGEKQEVCNAVHAEQNAITQAAVDGISIKGAKMYITHPPCSICARLIVNAEISEVITYGEYADENGLKILERRNIPLRRVPRPESKINFKD